MNRSLLTMSVAALLLATACTRQESASSGTADETAPAPTLPEPVTDGTTMPDGSTATLPGTTNPDGSVTNPDGTTTYPGGTTTSPSDTVPPSQPQTQSETQSETTSPPP